MATLLMTNNTVIDNAIKNIRLDKLNIETVVKEIEAQGNRNDFLISIRHRLTDDSYLKDRSICCGLIKEFNDKASLTLLWSLIGMEKTKGSRGSLVYAMEDMNPLVYLVQLVCLVINDNFEVLANSMSIIDNLDGYIDGGTLDKCIPKIKLRLMEPIPEWRKEALVILLEEFEDE